MRVDLSFVLSIILFSMAIMLAAPAAAEQPDDAPAAAEQPDDAPAAAEQPDGADGKQHWMLLLGAILMGIVNVLNRLGLAKRFGRSVVPWVTLGIAALGALGYGMMEGTSLLDALQLALIEGGIAIMLWETAFKHFSKAKTDGTDRRLTV